jgi:hypothetical protein
VLPLALFAFVPPDLQLVLFSAPARDDVDVVSRDRWTPILIVDPVAP